MVVSTQELRRRWTDKSNATFLPSNRASSDEKIPAESYEREFDFKGCRAIVFANGETHRSDGIVEGQDIILLTQGTGHLTLPAGVQVIVNSGYVKWEAAGRGGSRAPPGSRTSAPSEVGSSYSGYSRASGSGSAAPSGYGLRRAETMPSPPTGRSRVGSSAGSYVSARAVPLPPSLVSGGLNDMADDNCSIAPSESISSVGSRGGRGSVYY
ncbi:hypothetical protein QBC37DRAFT_419912 [Rhypophila decipiens]|uniref:Uncharacterized protein n=1 Tax=Rhypophila decipiens TaxID=261697 RepID=A0AAN6YAJ8_9PEZI|nr:hypothetical protein QBC37DRAFT_419912 [Rhypophila decipiens]